MSGFDMQRDDTPWEAAPGAIPNDWELAAAACELALLGRAGPLAALPAALADRIRHDAGPHLPPSGGNPARGEPLRPAGRSDGRSRLAAAGWWTAACLAGLLAWQWAAPRKADVPGGDGQPVSLTELRRQLLAEDPDAVRVAWKAGDDPAIIDGARDSERGDVVWSPARQQGFMRFRGVAANDPAAAQYQLWIFDADRDEAHPVDGGVFDVPADAAGDVVVRIDPRLPIGRATAFAVTVERPGGVVVSSRERLPLLAAVP